MVKSPIVGWMKFVNNFIEKNMINMTNCNCGITHNFSFCISTKQKEKVLKIISNWKNHKLR